MQDDGRTYIGISSFVEFSVLDGCYIFTHTKKLSELEVNKLSKLKHKNPKIKIEGLKKPKKNMFANPIPVDGFIEIDDPNYEIDDMFNCY